MRLFIAVNFNEEIKDNLMDAIQVLRNASQKGNFTRRENLHLTLVFIGEVDVNKLDRIKAVINGINEEPFKLKIGGIGRFKRHGGDIYWVGVEQNQHLLSIQQQLAEELRKEGFDIEKRDYKPHLTIGREILVGDAFNTNMLSQSLPDMDMEVKKISLMKSERIKGTLTYTEVYDKKLE